MTNDQSQHTKSHKDFTHLCNFGCGHKSLFFCKNGKSYCSLNGNGCPIKIEKDRVKKIGKKRPDLVGKIPHNKGLKKESSYVVAEITKAIKKSIAENGHNWQGKKHSIATKKKMSKNIINRYANGWQSTSCGRAKSYPYDSPIAGHMNLTGTWEVAFAQVLDKTSIKWSRNKKRFDYVKPDGIAATYLPDFYIDEWQTYVEIKGYETDLDKAKWAQFNEPLLVVRKKEIFQLKKWLKEDFDINKENLKQLLLFIPQLPKV